MRIVLRRMVAREELAESLFDDLEQMIARFNGDLTKGRVS